MGFEKFFYDRQTKARGLDLEALSKQLKRQAKWYHSRLAGFLPKEKDECCLDIPCGAGNFLYFLNSEGYENCKGFDLDVHQVNMAKGLGLPAEQGDVFDVLNDTKNRYKMIASLDFIEHVSKDNAVNFLELCYQNLDKGGVLMLRTPCADGPFGGHDRYNDITHQWGLSSGLIEVLLNMVGFDRVSVLDERPQPTGSLDTLRWLCFFPARLIANLFCIALGLRPPRIWSRSMFVVAYKPMQTGGLEEK